MELATTNARPDGSATRDSVRDSKDSKTPQVFSRALVSLVQTQVQRQKEDFLSVLETVPAAKAAHQSSSGRCQERFLYAWCIVNTRCLYYKTSAKWKGPIAKGDNMVLCPLVDLFNHQSSPGCTVQQEGLGFIVKSCKKPRPGTPNDTVGLVQNKSEQLFVSYGAHTNDTLFVQYGFVLPKRSNTHDSVNLDEFVLEGEPSDLLQQLEQHGYLGSYTLFAPQSQSDSVQDVCFRTKVCALLGVIDDTEWVKYINGEIDDSDLDDTVHVKASQGISAWVEAALQSATATVKYLESMAMDEEELNKVFLDDSEPLRSPEPMRKRVKLDEEALTLAHSRASLAADSHRKVDDLDMARTRHGLVLARSRQVFDICEAYLASHQTIEGDAHET